MNTITFQTNRQQFINAISTAASCTKGALKNIYVSLSKGKIGVTGSNAVLFYTEEIEGQASESFEFGVDSKKLALLLEAMQGDVQFRLKDRLSVKSSSSEASLSIETPEFKPQSPDYRDSDVIAQIDGQALMRALKIASFPVDPDASQIALSCVNISFDEGMIIATGFNRACISISKVKCPSDARAFQGFMIPVDSVKAIISVLKNTSGKVEVAISDGSFFISTDTATFSTLTSTGGFPDVKKSISKEFDYEASVPVKRVSESLKLIASLAEKDSSVEMTFSSDKIGLSLSGEMSSMEGAIPVTSTGSCSGVKSLRADSVLSAISELSGELVLHAGDKKDNFQSVKLASGDSEIYIFSMASKKKTTEAGE